MKMQSKQKGITLVALVVTIIILLILVGITISALGGENGLIAKVNQAKKVQIKAEMKETLILAINELQLEKEGKATLDDITQDWVSEKLKEYEGRIIESLEQDGKKIKMKKNGVTERFIIDFNLNVTNTNYDGNIEFSYKEKERNGNNVKISIYAQDEENGIEKIEFPDVEPYIGNGTKEEIILDYEIEIGKKYELRIISKSGEELEKTVMIDFTYYYVTMNLGEGIGIDNKSTKVIYNQPYTAKIIEDDDYILDNFTVTMNGVTINVDNLEGVINIDKVTGNIEITATSMETSNLSNLINIKEANKISVKDVPDSNDHSLIQEILFNGNKDERWAVCWNCLNEAFLW